MRQLGGIDAAFLNLERRNSTGHIGTICLLTPDPEGPVVDLEAITDLVSSRLHLVPIMRQRLAEVPLGLDHPYLVDDPHFDIEYHVREISLPSPGSTSQLCEQVARLHARPLDRTRPLWEIYLVQGLADGQLALYTKMHHASIDGASGAEVLGLLVDLAPGPPGKATEIEPYQPRREPRPSELFRRSLTSLAGRPSQGVRIARTALTLLPGLGAAVGPALRPAIGAVVGQLPKVTPPPRSGRRLLPPKTPFNAPITPHRRVALRTVDLADVRAVKTAHATSINDVFMAMAAGALRQWLREHEALPDQPLVSMVPVSLRDPGSDAAGNALSALFTALPTHLEEPRQRLEATREITTAAKEQQAAIPAGLVEDVTDFAPPALVARTARLAFALGLPNRVMPFNLVLSNVPGPQIQAYLCGSRLEAVYPIGLLLDGQGLNITVMSYRGGMHIGLTACRELIPDLDRLADLMVEELATLQQLEVL
jgi:diacylglycerol O-acyltransferase / wax synthase